MTGNQVDKLLTELQRIATALERIADVQEDAPEPHEHYWVRDQDDVFRCECGTARP